MFEKLWFLSPRTPQKHTFHQPNCIVIKFGAEDGKKESNYRLEIN